jgi:pimeloyl-ACP methyl ester carboxylesterase
MGEEQHRILITGSDYLLGSCLAAFYLARGGNPTYWWMDRRQNTSKEALRDAVTLALERNFPGQQTPTPTDLISRLQLLRSDAEQNRDFPDLTGALPIESVWLLSGGPAGLMKSRAHKANLLESVLAALPQLRAKQFNYVATPGPDEPAITRSIVELCQAKNIGYRIFRISLLFGENPILGQTHPFLQFLNELYDFKREIEERTQEYFEYHSLRCPIAEHASLNLITPDSAARLISGIALNPETLCGEYDVASSEDTPFLDICDRLTSIYRLNLNPAEPDVESNAIDSAFRERIEALESYLACAKRFNVARTCELASVPHEQLHMDENSQLEVLAAIYEAQEKDRISRDERASSLYHRLTKRTLPANSEDFTYFTGGSNGVPVVLLNALGQGLHYWARLIDILIERHKVIIWEPRGTFSASQLPPRHLSDQVDDLDTVLRHENVTSCHLIGWCTGPKVAVEYYLRRPEVVSSMVFLNGTFKCFGGPEELDTPYERNLEPLCQAVDSQPSMAGSVMKALAPYAGGINMIDESDAQQLAPRVLGLINTHLAAHILYPFQNESSTVNYVRQLLDFWSYDTKSKLPQVEVPVLLLSAEHDQIASPQMCRAAAQLLPKAVAVHVRGATHYCLYDRPDFVARHIEDFFDDVAQLIFDDVAERSTASLSNGG